MFGKLKKFFSLLGPGFITGASDDDPSGIGTYSQTGAQFGYSQLWLSLFGFPFMAAIQEMCGRIGLVTGKGLSGVMRQHYSKYTLYIAVILLLVANTINIGADLGAMASSAQLLFDIPFVVWLVAMTAFILVLEIFVSYRMYSRFLKYLSFSLLTYIFAAIVVKQEWRNVIVSTIIPTFTISRDYLFNIVAILGTTISPYLFFWQAGEEVEEEVKMKKLRTMGQGIPRIFPRDIKSMRIDTIVGMFFSQLIMFFIIITTASTLHKNGIVHIETASQAAEALRPLAGGFSYLLFALGVIGTGFLAVPILAGSASYALSEAFGWKEGLYRKFAKAHGFYGVIIVATIVGLLINFTPVKPFQVLYYTAVLNGIIAPPLIFMILIVSNNQKIMGKYTNTLSLNFMGITIGLFMFVASVLLILSIFKII